MRERPTKRRCEMRRWMLAHHERPPSRRSREQTAHGLTQEQLAEIIDVVRATDATFDKMGARISSASRCWLRGVRWQLVYGLN